MYDFKVAKEAELVIDKLLLLEPEGSKLRIQVLGGGCSGFKYKYSFDNELQSGDLVLCDGKVVIDDLSISFVAEGTLNYHEDLGSAGFTIMNPNTTAKCGCGNSFSV